MLTLVLTLAMLLSVMVVGAGAATFGDQDSITNKEAVDVCTTLNIIGGYEDGTFRPAGNVTRAEMSKMICVALNGGKEPTMGSGLIATFNDVAKDNWAAPYIEYCVSQGIVGGVGGGNFNPNGNITGTQAAKMLLCILGYNASIQGYVGDDYWETNINVDAAQKHLYDGLENIDASAALTRDQAAQMIWNALQANEVEYKTTLVAGPDGTLTSKVTVQDKVVSENKDYITLLEDKYDASINVGTLTGISGDKLTIGMSAADAADSDEAAIKNFSKLGVDYSDLMGQKVKVVFKSGKANSVLGVYATGDNTVYKAFANALSDDNGKIKFDGKSYSVEYTKTQGNTTAGTTALATYRDGAEVSALNVTDLDGMNTSADEVILVDTDDNGKIDTVCINSVTVAKVTYVSDTQIVAGGTTYKYEDENIASGIAKDDWVVITENMFDECKDIVTVAKINGTINGYKDKTTYHQYAVDGTWYNTANAKRLDASAGDKAEAVVYNGIIFLGDKTSAGSDANNVCVVLEKGDFNRCRLAFFDGTATKLVTLNDDSLDPTVGTAYVFELDGDEYELKALTAPNLDDDDYTIQSPGKLQAVSGSNWTPDTSDSYAKFVDTVAISDDAKVQIIYGTSPVYKAKMITGKQFKTLNWTTDTDKVLTSPSTTTITALASKVDGLNKISVLAVNVGTVEPGSFQTNDNYGVVVSGSYKYDSNYIAYSVFDGTNTIPVTEKTGASRAVGDIIGYSSITDEKVIEDVTLYAASGAVKESTTGGEFAVGAIQGINAKGDVITVNGTDEFKITSDTKVIFVDSDAEHNKDNFQGVASSATTVDKAYEADEIASSGMYYYNVAYILDASVSGGKADLAVLVIDVKGRMANNVETPKTVTLEAGDTATINGVAVVSGTTTLPKGQVMLVTIAYDGTVTLTGAVFADGSTTKTTTTDGEVVEVYGDSTATAISIDSADS